MKLIFIALSLGTSASLPTRERGLKLSYFPTCGIWDASLPTRERGLKYITQYIIKSSKVTVAPYAGAWIEIHSTAYLNCSRNVAPYAGAWIEISAVSLRQIVVFVAPYAGAWIEIFSRRSQMASRSSSLPTRERGLKSLKEILIKPRRMVAPYAGAWIEMMMLGSVKFCINVAPYAGAWIEMECMIQVK